MERRIGLIEFQRQLAARLGSTARAAPGVALLGLQAGEERWLCALLDTSEVLSVPTPVPTPHTKRWFRGLAHVRGAFYGIVDLSAFCGNAITPIDEKSRIILASPSLNMPFGLLVSRVLGLRRQDQLRQREALGTHLPWIEDEYTDEAGTLWKKLDMQRLVGYPEFQQAAQ